MNLEDLISAPARRLLSMAGDDVTVNYWERQKSNLTTDEYGDHQWGAPDISTDTHAEVVTRGTPTKSQTVAWENDDIQAMIWVRSDVDVSDGGHTTDDNGNTVLIRPSQIVVHSTGARYTVQELFDEANGKVRCICSQE